MLVCLLDFKSSVGLNNVPGEFDSHALPPFHFWRPAKNEMALPPVINFNCPYFYSGIPRRRGQGCPKKAQKKDKVNPSQKGLTLSFPPNLSLEIRIPFSNNH